MVKPWVTATRSETIVGVTMDAGRCVELVRVQTADGVVLDGAFGAPVSPTAGPCDACLIVHGTGSNFYAGGVLEAFAAQARAAGVAALRINTRGHDGVASLSGRRKGGAAFEHVADCHFDLRAWAGWLLARGYSRIALVGHSMGGVKSTMTLAGAEVPGVCSLIVISSPRFCHARLMQHPQAEAFRRDYERARDCVAQGRPDELLDVQQPLPLLITAAGFLDKYGPEDRYDLVTLLGQVTVPTLVVLGTQSARQSPAFDGLAEDLALLQQSGRLQLELVAGANTIYSGMEQVPFERAAAWWSRWSAGGPGE